MVTFTDKHWEQIRQAVKQYVKTEGCGCCADHEKHQEAQNEMGRLLKFKPYSDGSGYDFYERDDDDQN